MTAPRAARPRRLALASTRRPPRRTSSPPRRKLARRRGALLKARSADGAAMAVRCFRPPGQVRPTGVAPRHAGCITAAAKGRLSPAARAPGFPRGARRSRWSRRPIMPEALSAPRRLWPAGTRRFKSRCAVRSPLRSRAVKDGASASRRPPSRRRCTFRTASSSSGALYVTSYANLPRGSSAPATARPHPPARA